jgi:hypothetical protein
MQVSFQHQGDVCAEADEHPLQPTACGARSAQVYGPHVQRAFGGG